MTSVREVAGKGRGLVAERPFKAGEVVLSEKAILLVAEEQYLGQVCSACLKIAVGGMNFARKPGIDKFTGMTTQETGGLESMAPRPWAFRRTNPQYISQ
jgi:hypothetical protein